MFLVLYLLIRITDIVVNAVQLDKIYEPFKLHQKLHGIRRVETATLGYLLILKFFARDFDCFRIDVNRLKSRCILTGHKSNTVVEAPSLRVCARPRRATPVSTGVSALR